MTQTNSIKLYAEVFSKNHSSNTDIVFKVEVPFSLNEFKLIGAEYTRNWCKEILMAYAIGHPHVYKLLLKTKTGKRVKVYSLTSIS